MLFDLTKLKQKWGMEIRGVLHVGAHLAEEAAEYDKLDVGSVWWVEAFPQLIPKIKAHIKSYPNQQVIEGLVYSEAGQDLGFNVTNHDSMSSSIFEFGTHPDFSPDTKFVDRLTLRSTTIDDIVQSYGVKANLLNMDLQGAELHALLGATEFLGQVDYIYTEVNKVEVYRDCAQVGELDELLSDFDRVETTWVLTTLSRSRGKKDDGWGDALYIRRQS